MSLLAAKSPQAESYSLMGILKLVDFRPDIRDHAYPLEMRLKQHRIKELAVFSGDGTRMAVHLLTKDGKDNWTASPLGSVTDIGARPVIGVFAAPDVPAVLRIAPKAEAVLANILATSPRKAMIEGVTDDSMRVQSVRLGGDRHITWRIQGTSLQRFERPLPPDSALIRVTNGISSVTRIALEHVSSAGSSPDAILCCDHHNHLWLEFPSGRPSEAIRPRELSTEEELAEWLETIAYDIPSDRTFVIQIWTSPFSWLQEVPPALVARLPQNLKFTLMKVPMADLVFA